MLTTEQIQQNSQKYLELITRLQVDLTEFSKFLMATDFFNKPASTQYNRAYPGGLCEQALIVCQNLGNLCNMYFPGKYSSDDIIKVALLKDLYRAELYESYLKNVKDEATDQWMSVSAYKNKEIRPVYGDMGLSSYMIAAKYFELTEEQTLAIIHSSGLNNYSCDIHEVMKQYPLVTLAKMADIAASYININ